MFINWSGKAGFYYLAGDRDGVVRLEVEAARDGGDNAGGGIGPFISGICTTIDLKGTGIRNSWITRLAQKLKLQRRGFVPVDWARYCSFTVGLGATKPVQPILLADHCFRASRTYLPVGIKRMSVRSKPKHKTAALKKRRRKNSSAKISLSSGFRDQRARIEAQFIQLQFTVINNN